MQLNCRRADEILPGDVNTSERLVSGPRFCGSRSRDLECIRTWLRKTPAVQYVHRWVCSVTKQKDIAIIDELKQKYTAIID